MSTRGRSTCGIAPSGHGTFVRQVVTNQFGKNGKRRTEKPLLTCSELFAKVAYLCCFCEEEYDVKTHNMLARSRGGHAHGSVQTQAEALGVPRCFRCGKRLVLLVPMS